VITAVTFFGLVMVLVWILYDKWAAHLHDDVWLRPSLPQRWKGAWTALKTKLRPTIRYDAISDNTSASTQVLLSKIRPPFSRGNTSIPRQITDPESLFDAKAPPEEDGKEKVPSVMASIVSAFRSQNHGRVSPTPRRPLSPSGPALGVLTSPTSPGKLVDLEFSPDGQALAVT
jgi:hypothetical protein